MLGWALPAEPSNDPPASGSLSQLFQHPASHAAPAQPCHLVLEVVLAEVSGLGGPSVPVS